MIKFLEELKKDVVKMHGKIEAALNKLNIEKEPEEDGHRPPSRNEMILKVALAEIGVKEVAGPQDNPRIVKYHKFATINNDVGQKDSVPWCSSFLCYVIEHVFPHDGDGKPMGSTNSMLARSWLKWGVSTKDDPMPGDIVVYWRGTPNGWQGHCGIFLKRNQNGSIITLGGNQNDEVNVSIYSGSKLLDIRRSSKSRVFDGEDKSVLKVIAHGIVNGRYVADGGKVD